MRLREGVPRETATWYQLLPLHCTRHVKLVHEITMVSDNKTDLLHLGLWAGCRGIIDSVGSIRTHTHTNAGAVRIASRALGRDAGVKRSAVDQATLGLCVHVVPYAPDSQ